MTILLVVGSLLALTVAVAMSLRAGTLTTRMLEELNAEPTRGQKISVVATSGSGRDAVQRDRQIQPGRELQRRFWMAPAIAIVSGFVMIVCWSRQFRRFARVPMTSPAENLGDPRRG